MRVVVLACAAAAATGCGDEVRCPQAALILIESPTRTVTMDLDPSMPGMQTDVVVRTTLLPGTTVELVARDDTGTQFLFTGAATDVNGEALFAGVTLPAGVVTLEATASDACGPESDSVVVDVSPIGTLQIAFAPPVADGLVGGRDGEISGASLTLPLCGTVNMTGAVVTVSIDGATPEAADVSGTTWCHTVTLAASPPSYTVVANASTAGASGSVMVQLEVDLITPDPIADLAATAVDRQRVRLAWTAPSEAGAAVEDYIVKYATSPITEQNFDTFGTLVATGSPLDPGQAETVDVFPARTGTVFWIAAATADRAGNRSPIATAGPVTPLFTHSGGIHPGDPTAGDLTVGWSIASGKFDDDELIDVAIGAPGQDIGGLTRAGMVSVFLGTPTGIPTTPDLVIEGTSAGGRLGSGLTAVRWSQPDRDDLVIGAPLVGGGNGAVRIIAGGAGFPTGTITDAAAAITIAPAATPGWFAGANLGTVLATGRIDDDAVDDLVISAPTGGGARGGIVIIYGGTATAAAIGLSDVDADAAAGAVATLIEDPAATTGHRFGLYTHVVGPTTGATDVTDDIVVGYDDDGLPGDAAYLFRPDGSRPTSAGVTQGGFVAGRDVRIFYDTAFTLTGFASQATTIADQNGDGARELVISAYRAASLGQVLIVDGDTLGTAGVAATTAPGVVLTTIGGDGGTIRLGAALASGGAHHAADIDGDGREDLMVAGATAGVGRFYVWFGGSIPTGSTSVASAGHAITAPSNFLFNAPAAGRGPAGQARWVGDVDGDGLDDVCWSSPNSSARDGGFELLR